MSGIARTADGVRPIAGVAWGGLARVLSGSGRASTWGWRSPWQRRMVGAALGAATVLLCVASVASVASTDSQRSGSSTGNSSAGPGRASCHISSSATYCHEAGGLLLRGGAAVPVTLLVLLALAVVAPMTLVIRYPLLGWWIGWLGLLLVPLLDLRWWGGWPWDPVQISVLLVVLSAAGIRLGRSALCWLCALTLFPWWFWAVEDGPGVVIAALGSVAFGAIAVAVDSMGSRRRVQQSLADQAEQTELERARRAVLEERARIARELHDVVAHHMSLMAIRAESAPHRLGEQPDPELVHAEFGALSGSARDALTDMRRLLGVLRSDQPAARAPQPGLPDLPGLIDTARRAGMAVELSPLPAPDQVPLSAGVCAYRIIQEALSNAGQHAPGTPVTVSVQHDADAVTLRVTNGAQARPRTNGHRPGHGLSGMRERAELLGGSLSAGTAPDGGFVVSAVLPLTGSAV
jgi:signal transduction histidine kinase